MIPNCRFLQGSSPSITQCYTVQLGNLQTNEQSSQLLMSECSGVADVFRCGIERHSVFVTPRFASSDATKSQIYGITSQASRHCLVRDAAC